MNQKILNIHPVGGDVVEDGNHFLADQKREGTELRKRFGWSHSKITDYESPPPDEIMQWRLEEQYIFSDMEKWIQRQVPYKVRRNDIWVK
ncbi:MAG: hypothetical protein JXA42_16560 [Anaerolineales bacterium]|nr:hypothetical protein [Anaerolineales bacterium]